MPVGADANLASLASDIAANIFAALMGERRANDSMLRNTLSGGTGDSKALADTGAKCMA